MKILAVEFSSAHRSVAIVESGNVLGVAGESEGHRGIGLVVEALRLAGTDRAQIEAIAVGLGPGSYTGIRAAIALAQGWQLGQGTKLLGLGSASCLAAQAHAKNVRGALNIIIDAQRNEFYLARFALESESWRESEPLRLATKAEIQSLADSGQRLAGPDVSTWFPGATDLYPEAAVLGTLACSHTNFIPGEKLEPIYLREADFKKAPPPRIID